VLGIDDFAMRCGDKYGTILINIETGRPLDLLPDRTAEAVKPPLASHPEIQVVSRDRASAFADAVSQVLPHAMEARGSVSSHPKSARPSPALPGSQTLLFAVCRGYGSQRQRGEPQREGRFSRRSRSRRELCSSSRPAPVSTARGTNLHGDRPLLLNLRRTQKADEPGQARLSL